MGAAILEAVDGAVAIAHHDDRQRAHEVGAVVALVRDVGLEADVVPGRTFEQAAELSRVVGGVLVDPVGDAGDGIFRPDIHGVHSRVTFAVLMTALQRASSSLMKAAVAAVLWPIGSAPCDRNFSRTSASFRAAAASAFIFCRMASGVPCRATSSNQ